MLKKTFYFKSVISQQIFTVHLKKKRYHYTNIYLPDKCFLLNIEVKKQLSVFNFINKTWDLIKFL